MSDLHEKLAAALDARSVMDTQAWRDAWDGVERELMIRFMACAPEDDLPRFRVQEAIKAARQVRSAIESKARSAEQLQKDLDLVEGRKLRPIA